MKEYEIAVRWRAFPLHPAVPEEGLTLEALFADYSLDLDRMMRRVEKTAEELGLPFGKREKTYNSRLCQELGKWAESKNRGHEFHMAAFRAYFVDGKNIAEPEVLEGLAASVFLPRAEAVEVLESRSFKEAVDSDWALSRQCGVTSVPTFMAGKESLVGAQPYGMLERLVTGNGAKRRGETRRVELELHKRIIKIR